MESSLSPAPLPTIKALLLSMNETRYAATVSLLAQCGIHDVTRIWPLPPDEASVHTIAGLLQDSTAITVRGMSSQLSQRHTWVSVALDSTLGIPDDGYAVFFEDDIALDASVDPASVVDIIHHAAVSSRETGLFYLGMGCDWHCADSMDEVKQQRGLRTWESSWTHRNVTFTPCVGLWTHAVGLHKWRAQWLWDEVSAATRAKFSMEFKNEAIDIFLLMAHYLGAAINKWPVLAGASLRSHDRPYPDNCRNDIDGGIGLFYQASSKYPSQRLGMVPIADVRAMQLEATTAGRPYPQLRSPLQPTTWNTRLRAAVRMYTISDSGDVTCKLAGCLASARGVPHVCLPALRAEDRIVRLQAAYTCTGAHCNALLPVFRQVIARTLSHRDVWMRISVDRSVQDNDYVLVTEGVPSPLLASPDFGRLVTAAAHDSQHAGIFWLSECGDVTCAATAAACTAETPPSCRRCVSDCLHAYGIFKWRAAWLWDVVQATQRKDSAFHANNTNTASLGAYLRASLPLRLPEEHWPVLLPVFE